MLPEDTISVIMGIKYCRPELDTLRRSLDSILAQTYAEFELLICERGSSHLAKELLADYASRDPRVRVIDGSGAGSFSEQLNICLGQSRGAWIARMDDDDYSEPERFEKQLAYLRTHGGTAFDGCNVRLIQDGGDVGAQCFPENPQVRDFLFSMQPIISNKKFILQQGGTIQFSGDPMDAMLNINAIYKLKASLQPLLQGTSDNLAADRSVPVECVIHLGERLSNPAVTFDVHVPGTDPETQTVIANALTTPETVDTQFAYLLLFNSFMGENSSSSSNIGTSVSAATGLEFVSNMVSNLLSNDDYNIVIRYRPKSELTSDEVDFGLSKSLINNRLFVEVEGNYLIDNKQAVNSSMSNFMGEAYITYLIDRAGTLKAKAFTQTIDRFDENQGLQETGIGIYFKEDFNNFRDLRRRIRERFTNKKRKARREARRQAAREEKERLRQPADTLSALRPVMDKKDENN